jgi:hypothetical protein
MAMVYGVLVAAPESADGPMSSVIVREVPTAGDEAERMVSALGGVMGLRIDLIDAFEATISAPSSDSSPHYRRSTR